MLLFDLMKDKIVAKLIKQEEKRQAETLNLIPSENLVSRDVLEALGSVLTNKYAEGYSRNRYYGGNEFVDKLESLTKERALKAFGLSEKKWSVNVQPYSGSPANLAIYLALVPLHEKIMGMRLDMGGHLTHGHGVSATGKIWKQVPYGVDRKTETLDYAELMKIAKKEKPKLVVAGFTAYSRTIDFKKFRKIADAAKAYLMVDMSHFAGLVAGKACPSPFLYADVVMATTQKTLRGPRAALIFSKKELSPLIDKAVFPGLQGGPHANNIAAVAVALEEARSAKFKNYAKQIVKNAKVLANELKRLGWRIISGGTDTHLLMIDTAKRGILGKEAGELLEKAGIIVNKNTIPFDINSPFNPSGIRIGSPSATTRGMKEKEMKKIAGWIDGILSKKMKPGAVKKEVVRLCRKFKI
jgi:glycine hydroxymethyltransferase